MPNSKIEGDKPLPTNISVHVSAHFIDPTLLRNLKRYTVYKLAYRRYGTVGTYLRYGTYRFKTSGQPRFHSKQLPLGPFCGAVRTGWSTAAASRARRAGAAALGFARKRHGAALRRLLPYGTLFLTRHMGPAKDETPWPYHKYLFKYIGQRKN